MSWREEALAFDCAGDQLLGILTRPDEPPGMGVVIVVGGPQYRVGSHRQFVLLARTLAQAGHACLRFDHRGLGDSAGHMRDFEHIDQDIGAAIDQMLVQAPSVRRVVLWGLCDAASASMLYWHAKQDARLAGMVLVNPWVRTDDLAAAVRVRHYYGQRLLKIGFWKKLLSGKLAVRQSLGELLAQIGRVLAHGRRSNDKRGCFQDIMSEVFGNFPGKLLVILSGDDYTAKEFSLWFASQPASSLQHAGSRLQIEVVADADHTFSSAVWRNDVQTRTAHWLNTVLERPQ